MSALDTVTAPAVPPSPDERRAQFAAQEALEAIVRVTNRAALFAALAGAGISHVVVSYDGYSDSGQIESVDVRTGDAIVALPAATITCAVVEWGKPTAALRLMPIIEMVERIVYDLLETTRGGWEDGEGAYGEFVFDVAAGAVMLDHNERYTATESYSHRF